MTKPKNFQTRIHARRVSALARTTDKDERATLIERTAEAPVDRPTKKLLDNEPPESARRFHRRGKLTR